MGIIMTETTMAQEALGGYKSLRPLRNILNTSCEKRIFPSTWACKAEIAAKWTLMDEFDRPSMFQ